MQEKTDEMDQWAQLDYKARWGFKDLEVTDVYKQTTSFYLEHKIKSTLHCEHKLELFETQFPTFSLRRDKILSVLKSPWKWEVV